MRIPTFSHVGHTNGKPGRGRFGRPSSNASPKKSKSDAEPRGKTIPPIKIQARKLTGLSISLAVDVFRGSNRIRLVVGVQLNAQRPRDSFRQCPDDGFFF